MCWCENAKTNSSRSQKHFPKVSHVTIMNEMKITLFSILSLFWTIEIKEELNGCSKSRFAVKRRLGNQTGPIQRRFDEEWWSFHISHFPELRSASRRYIQTGWPATFATLFTETWHVGHTWHCTSAYMEYGGPRYDRYPVRKAPHRVGKHKAPDRENKWFRTYSKIYFWLV